MKFAFPSETTGSVAVGVDDDAEVFVELEDDGKLELVDVELILVRAELEVEDRLEEDGNCVSTRLDVPELDVVLATLDEEFVWVVSNCCPPVLRLDNEEEDEVTRELLALVVEAARVPFLIYTFRRLPAPHSSELSPAHNIEQSLSFVITAPLPNLLSHQHSRPYSTPK